VDTDEVLFASPVKSAPQGCPIIPPPPGHADRIKRLSAKRALLRLLTRNPNTIVTHAEVEAEVGGPVSAGAVSNAATALRVDIAVRSKAGPGGGYVLLVPVDGYRECCVDCRHRTALSHCRELDREVTGIEWCWGWTARD
jgi:hypothetical protein